MAWVKKLLLSLSVLSSCYGSAYQMVAKWRDSYKGDLSPWWFWQLYFCSIWCPAERGEHNQRFSFAHIQRETVVLVPWCKSLYLIQVCGLIIVGNEAQNHSIISEFDDRSGAVRGHAVMCVERVEQDTASYLQFGPNDCKVILKPRHGYVAKVLSIPFRAQVISLLALPIKDGEQGPYMLCPVRALRV